MNRSLSIRRLSNAGLFAALLLVASTASTAKATPILSFKATEIHMPFSWYTFTIYNNFDPLIDPGVNLQRIQIELIWLTFRPLGPPPAGWDFIYSGPLVNLVSTAGTGLPPGGSLYFSVIYETFANPFPFVANFFNPDDPTTPLVVTGTAVNMPEPNSSILIAFGIVGVLLRKRFTVWKKSS